MKGTIEGVALVRMNYLPPSQKWEEKRQRRETTRRNEYIKIRKVERSNYHVVSQLYRK